MKLRRDLVESWDDERAIGNAIIVALRPGRKFSHDMNGADHVAGFDTVKEANAGVLRSVPCACGVCTAALEAARRDKKRERK